MNKVASLSSRSLHGETIGGLVQDAGPGLLNCLAGCSPQLDGVPSLALWYTYTGFWCNAIQFSSNLRAAAWAILWGPLHPSLEINCDPMPVIMQLLAIKVLWEGQVVTSEPVCTV